jgi:hypothetical protein
MMAIIIIIIIATAVVIILIWPASKPAARPDPLTHHRAAPLLASWRARNEEAALGCAALSSFPALLIISNRLAVADSGEQRRRRPASDGH